MYNNRRMFIKYMTDNLAELNKAECPSHYECGAQDAWSEAVCASIASLELALECATNGYDHYGTDRVRFKLAIIAVEKARNHFISDLEQDLIESWHENKMYFEEKYHQYIASGQDVIS